MAMTKMSFGVFLCAVVADGSRYGSADLADFYTAVGEVEESHANQQEKARKAIEAIKADAIDKIKTVHELAEKGQLDDGALKPTWCGFKADGATAGFCSGSHPLCCKHYSGSFYCAVKGQRDCDR